MADGPDDRVTGTPETDANEVPEIYMIVNGEKFPRPGLETYFAEAKPSGESRCSCDSVGGIYCSCNKVTVCSCVPVCTCQAACTCVGACKCVAHRRCQCVGHRTCQCVGHRSPGSRGSGGSVVGCRCAPVH